MLTSPSFDSLPIIHDTPGTVKIAMNVAEPWKVFTTCKKSETVKGTSYQFYFKRLKPIRKVLEPLCSNNTLSEAVLRLKGTAMQLGKECWTYQNG